MMRKCFLTLLMIGICLSGCNDSGTYPLPWKQTEPPAVRDLVTASVSLDEIPEYSGAAYVTINGNVPFFDDSELVTDAFETYSPLDALGRCGVAYANICREIMPTEERGDIGSVKPAGWHLMKYDAVEGNYLYNRCHLIGYQLAGENANERNLITGTRYLNVTGMGPFEDMVADYVKTTEHHVLYRVSPLFDGDNLLASGVLMEAKSVEDNGEGVLFNVFCYNVQPGIAIDYASGDSRLQEPAEAASAAVTYILNTNTKKFHLPECASVGQMADRSRQAVSWSREECMAGGYEPCKSCKP